MTLIKTSLCAAALLCGSLGAAIAQDSHGGHDMGSMGNGGFQLPEICTSGGEQPAGDMAMGMDHEMDEAHAAMMKGMDEMNRQMMIGMMAEDVDVAFVCGMIPHHQGAINMARAELEHGDNEWAKEMAQKVIDAQEQEIADMLAWLEEQAAAE